MMDSLRASLLTYARARDSSAYAAALQILRDIRREAHEASVLRARPQGVLCLGAAQRRVVFTSSPPSWNVPVAATRLC